jgi:hypothetical protein
LYAHVRARVHACACTCAYICMHRHVCVRVCTCMCMRTRAWENRHLLTLLLLPREPPFCRCLRSAKTSRWPLLCCCCCIPLCVLSNPPSHLLSCYWAKITPTTSCLCLGRPSQPIPVHAHKTNKICPTRASRVNYSFLVLATHREGVKNVRYMW